MYYTYITQCQEGRFYIGSTNNLQKRLNEHNNKKSYWTKKYNNWKLAHQEMFSSRRGALIRERWLKKQKTGGVSKNLINQNS